MPAPAPRRKRNRIGDVYVEMGILTPDQRNEVLRICRTKRLRFLDGLLQKGYVSTERLKEVFGKDFEKDLVSVKPDNFPIATQNLFSAEFMMTYGVLPLGIKVGHEGRYALIGMLTPNDLGTIEMIGKRVNLPIQSALITSPDLMEILQKVYDAPVMDYAKSHNELLHPNLMRYIHSLHEDIEIEQKTRALTVSIPLGGEVDEQTLILLRGPDSMHPFSADIQGEDSTTMEFRPKPIEPKIVTEKDQDHTRKRLSIASALAYRVMPPITPAPKEKKMKISDSDRRTEIRKNLPEDEFLVGIKIKGPERVRGKHRKGILRQFSVRDLSQGGYYLYGNVLDELDEGRSYEMLFSGTFPEGNNRFHLSFVGKVVRQEPSANPEEVGVAVAIQWMTEDAAAVWKKIAKKFKLVA